MQKKDLKLILLMTLLLCVLAPISIPTSFNAVSMTVATFAVFLAAYVLQPKYAACAIALYLLLGLVGLPVFSGFEGGIKCFEAPRGGYLVSYLFLAVISSWFIHRSENLLFQIFGMLFSVFAMYFIATVWNAVIVGENIFAASLAYALIFLPLDMLKVLLAFLLGPRLQYYLDKHIN